VRTCAPPTIVTALRGTPYAFASTSTSSALAAPSTGGDCSRTLSEPSGSTEIPGFDARGTTFTVSTTRLS
jgi:hypothetical protein